MNIDDIRYANYRALFAQFEERDRSDGNAPRGLLNRFGDFVGVSARYLSHVNARRKNLGERTTHAIEKAFNLPESWMDTDHSRGTDPSGDAEVEFTKLALQLYRESPTEAQAVMMRYMAEKLLRPKPKPLDAGG
jgi:hypothetical protein